MKDSKLKNKNTCTSNNDSADDNYARLWRYVLEHLSEFKKSMLVFQNDGSKTHTQKEMKDHTESKEIPWNVCTTAHFPRREPEWWVVLPDSFPGLGLLQSKCGDPLWQESGSEKKKCVSSLQVHCSNTHTHTHQSISYINQDQTHTHIHKITTETIILPKPLPPLTAKEDLFLFCSLFPMDLQFHSTIETKQIAQTPTPLQRSQTTQKKSSSFVQANENERT